MELTLLIFWSLWLLFIFVAACRVIVFPFAKKSQDKLWGDGSRNQQPVALVIAVKGFDLQATQRFFDSVFAQNYSNFRVIVAFETWEDPAALWLAEHLELGKKQRVWFHPDRENGLRSVTLVCAGPSLDEGQKVHNQIAAFSELNSEDAIVAFADADITCRADWLARLVAPINQSTHPLSTTYRWLVPKRPSLPNQLASVINGSITTQGGSELTNILWGGSMALSREVFDDLDVPTLLTGSLNDDLRLSKAARAKGHRIAFVRSLIIPTQIDFDWRGFFEFARRQYTQVKFFSPILYTGTNIVLGFYLLGAVSIVLALIYGYFYAWIPVAAAYVIDQFRSLARQQVYLSLFREVGIQQKLFAASWLEHMLTPFWMIIHWGLLASTWTQDQITWAGIRYQILSKSKTRVLSRPTSIQPLPAGAPGLAMIGSVLDGKRAAFKLTQPVQIPEPIRVDSALDENAASATEAPEPAAVVVPMSEEVAACGTLPTIQSYCGGISAVSPLTTTFPRNSRPISPSRERGRFSAIEAILCKSRVRATALSVMPSPKWKSESRPETISASVKKPAPLPWLDAQHIDADSSTLAWAVSRSYAARRVQTGIVNRYPCSFTSPSVSSRVNQASRPCGGIAVRPFVRQPSGRS